MQQQGVALLPFQSVQKSLTKLLSLSSNRSCADCRSTLVDPSQVHASVSPTLESSQTRIPHYKNFRFNHQSFAPPGQQSAKGIPEVHDPPVDPALDAPTRVGGHGVFVCALCGAAHKLLGPSVATVHAVQDLLAWSRQEVQILAQAGGNARSWFVFEAYVPHYWESKRPTAESSIDDRLIFIRAKYEALAFILPPPGPLAPPAWRRIVRLHPEWHGLWGADLHGTTGSEGLDVGSQIRRLRAAAAAAPRRSELPDRLVDYFCVVTASDNLDPIHNDLSASNSPEDVLLIPQVSDCYPPPETYGRGQEFPEHVSTFLFPDGCRPSSRSLPPSFFTFVLTGSNGDRLYGGVLRLYDDDQDIDYLRQAIEDSNFKGELPLWVQDGNADCFPPSQRGRSRCSQRSNTSLTSDVVFLPKCLVVISHYPFFDLWRKFLLQLYRIALVEAPLPIERFIANFTSEVPLPPPGKIRVKFGFTVKDNWCIQRPPENQLPLANFSFQPLFTALSIPNILIVFACLLQESRVALLSRYYGLLGPVAEALTSLLFPLHWEGMYLPVLPYHMLDILDAPVPYLVGLHSRYLREHHPTSRPRGVVFVDLDCDEVHLGFEDDMIAFRQIPCLPERQATKLKAKLEEYAARVYVIPPSSQVGTVTTGEGEQILLAGRRSSLFNSSETSVTRRDVFGSADKAYRDNELQAPICGFLSEHGQFFEQELPAPPGTVTSPKSVFPLLRRNRTTSFENISRDTDHHAINLLDLEDPPGFSTQAIRDAFLRFFVSLLQDYRQYLSLNSFRSEDFINSLSLSVSSTVFVNRLVKTQMFDCFIDERMEDSFDPEVQFFDESIAAKVKRSKRNAIAKIGRHQKKGSATAFLEDNSAMVTETFTPPPPSNWGLPDDGRTYSYGTFPTLNPDLFGKIRPPRRWHKRRSSSMFSRRKSVQTVASEQAVFMKAMVPIVQSGSTLLEATRRGARTLEHAIVTLSTPFVTTSTETRRGSFGDRFSAVSDLTVTSDLMMSEDLVTSAEEVVLNARRKQAILLCIITTFQAHCRKRFDVKTKKSILGALQTSISDSESTEVVKDYFVVTKLQARIRGFLVRCSYWRSRSAASRIQAAVRGRRTRFAFMLVRQAIVRAQALCRGYVVRLRMAAVISGRLLLYRQHIFLLWMKSSISLCYRSKFWLLIRKEGFVQLAVAEEEVRSLWGELGMSPPSFATELEDPSLGTAERKRLFKDLKMDSERYPYGVISASVSLGISGRVYFQTLSLHEREKSDRSRQGNSSGTIRMAREAAERTQVYDRLSTSSLFAHEERLNEYFQRFRVPLKEKRKKMMLSEMIWCNYSRAEESARLMLELFPELKDFSDMNFREPSKKTKGRFKSSNTRPDPLEPRLRSHALFQDRIHRSIVLVADASLRFVPVLLPRLATIDERAEAEKREINRRLHLRMSSGSQELSSVRIAVMRELVQRISVSEHSFVKSNNAMHRLAKAVSVPGSSTFWTDDVGKENFKFNSEKYLHKYRKSIELSDIVESTIPEEERSEEAPMCFS